MQRRVVFKYCVRLALAISVALCGCIVYGVYSLSTFHIAFKPLTEEDRRKFSALAKALEKVESYPHREVDKTSVGFPVIERKLQDVDQLVTAFQFRFGRLPFSIAELTAIPEVAPWFRRERAKIEIRLESWNCRIFGLTADSYFLNCDGWSPHEKTLQDLKVAADKRYVRFHNFSGHVVLSVPPAYVTPP